jgi:drug/metabolite transporter (DMT)-like permease
LSILNGTTSIEANFILGNITRFVMAVIVNELWLFRHHLLIDQAEPNFYNPTGHRLAMDATETVTDKLSTEWYLLGTIVIFGINYPLLKFVASELSVFETNAFRFTLGAAVLGILIQSDLVRSFRRIRSHTLEIVLLASMGYLASPLLLVYGLQYSSASNAALILASAPIWTAITSWLIGNDKIEILGWIGMGISILGLLIVTIPNSGGGGPLVDTLYGDLFLVSDAVIWGGYVSLQRNLLEKTSPLETGFWSLLAVLPFLYLGVFFGPGVSPDFNLGLSSIGWLALFFSGVFSMGLAHVWWNTSLVEFGPTTVSIYSNAIPVVAILAGWGLLGDPLSTSQLLGGLVVLVGVWLSRKSRIRRGIRMVGPPES